MRSSRALAAFAAALRCVAAIDCGAFYNGIYAYNFDTYLDPSDPSYPEAYVQPQGCNTYNSGAPETYGVTLQYTSTGSDGSITPVSQAVSTTMTDQTDTSSVYTYHFDQIPFTAIGNSVSATLIFNQILTGDTVSLPITFTQTIKPQTSFVAVTSTLPTTVSPTVTTQTVLASATTTSSATLTQTVTRTVATISNTAPTPLTTVTRTITPPPCIETKYSITVTTVRPTCVSGRPNPPQHGPPRVDVRQNSQRFEFPNSVDSTTTITTSTVIVYSTTTAGQTSLTTLTTTSTALATTTATIVDDASTTVTTTPVPSTIHTTTTQHRATTTTTRTITITHSQCGHGLPPCSRRLAPSSNPKNLKLGPPKS